MKRQKDVRKSTPTEDPWLVLQEVWNNLPAEFLQKLCEGVLRGTDAFLKAERGHTKYRFDLDFAFSFTAFCWLMEITVLYITTFS